MPSKARLFLFLCTVILTFQLIDRAAGTCTSALYTLSTATITDGSADGADYDADEDCLLRINPSGMETGDSIQIQFHRFDLEGGNCRYDCFKVFQGNTTLSEVAYSFSGGSLPSQITIPSHTVLIHFYSDDSNQKNGFSFTYNVASAVSVRQVMQNITYFGLPYQNGAEAYLGISYANPLRWRKSEAALPTANTWAWVQQPQIECAHLQNYAGYSSDLEQCLYLNIFRPNTTAAGPPPFPKKPTMVFVTGGTFQDNYPSPWSTNMWAQNWAATHDMIVITLNYRVGALGFLVYEEEFADDGTYGNYGLYDVLAAMDWIKQVGPLFGVDVGAITLAGEGTGADLIYNLISSNRTNGLVQGVILQSGSSTTIPTLSQALTLHQPWIESTGCTNLTCLRALPLEQILNSKHLDMNRKLSWGPIIDYNLLRYQTYVGVNQTLRLPGNQITRLLIGFTLDEALSLFPNDPDTSLDLTTNALHFFNSSDVNIIRLAYDPIFSDSGLTEVQSFRQFFQDFMYKCGARTMLNHVVGIPGITVYGYRFDIAPEFSSPAYFGADATDLNGNVATYDISGAYHTADLVYLFDNFLLESSGGSSWKQHQVLQSYWSTFVTTGGLNATLFTPYTSLDPNLNVLAALDNDPYVNVTALDIAYVVENSKCDTVWSHIALAWTNRDITTASGICSAASTNVTYTCNGTQTFISDCGTITDGAGNYAPNADCTWNLGPELPSAGLVLKFLSFDLQCGDGASSGDCETDCLVATAGEETVFSHGCNSITPVKWIDDDVVSLNFYSDDNTQASGFVLSFAAVPLFFTDSCSGSASYSNDAGMISDGPGDYQNNIQCAFNINPVGTTNESVIVMYVETLDLEYHPSCEFDVLNVYPQGYEPFGLCGELEDEAMNFTSTSLRITFDTDASVTEDGFIIGYVHYPHGFPSLSFNTPTNVTMNVRQWQYFKVVMTAQDKITSVLFTTSGSTATDGCVIVHRADALPTLTTYDGISTFTGTVNNSVELVAPTQTHIYYVGVYALSTDVTTITATPTLSNPCGGVVHLLETSGSITDGSGSANYAANSDCTWIIDPSFAAADSFVVAFEFLLFSLEDDISNECLLDCLRFYNLNQTVLYRSSSGFTLPDPLVVVDSAVLVRFTSDRVIQYDGFRLNYVATPVVTLLRDVPNLNNSLALSDSKLFRFVPAVVGHLYPAQMTIQVVTASGASNLRLYVRNALPPTTDTYQQSLSVSEAGTYTLSVLNPAPGDWFILVVASYDDDVFNITGSWDSTVLCNGDLYLVDAADSFEDGSSGYNYQSDMLCYFYIVPDNSPTGIVLFFSEFSVEYAKYCNYDCLSIYLEDEEEPSYTLSGTDLPHPLLLNASYITVEFSSDSINELGGFRAGYIALPNGVPSLSSSNAVTGVVLEEQWQFYQYTIGAGDMYRSMRVSVAVSANTSDVDTAMQFFARLDSIPSSSVFDQQGEFVSSSSSMQVVIDWPSSGTWYFGLYGAQADTQYSITLGFSTYQSFVYPDGSLSLTAGTAVTGSFTPYISGFAVRSILVMQLVHDCPAEVNISVWAPNAPQNYANGSQTYVHTENHNYTLFHLDTSPISTAQNFSLNYLGSGTCSNITVAITIQFQLEQTVSLRFTTEDVFPLIVTNVNSPVSVVLTNDDSQLADIFLASRVLDSFTEIELENLYGTSPDDAGVALTALLYDLPGTTVIVGAEHTGVSDDGGVKLLTLNPFDYREFSLTSKGGFTSCSMANTASIPGSCRGHVEFSANGNFQYGAIVQVSLNETAGTSDLQNNDRLCACESTYLVYSYAEDGGGETYMSQLGWLPSQVCFASDVIPPTSQAANITVLWTLIQLHGVECAAVSALSPIEPVEIAETESEEHALELNIPDRLFRFYFFVVIDVAVIETSFNTRDLAEVHLYARRVRGSPDSDPDVVNMVEADQYSFRALENQLVIETPSVQIIGLFGFNGGTILVDFTAPQYQRLRLGEQTAVSVKDGFRQYYTWKLSGDFPSSSVSYLIVPIIRANMTSSPRSLSVGFQANSQWYQIPSLANTPYVETMWTLQYEHAMYLALPFVDGFETAQLSLSAEAVATLEVGIETDIVVRGGVFPIGWYQWQWKSNLHLQQALYVEYQVDMQCVDGLSISILGSNAGSSTDFKNHTISCSNTTTEWVQRPVLMSPSEFLTTTSFSLRSSSAQSKATITSALIRMILLNDGSGSPEISSCSTCNVFIGATLMASFVDIYPVSLNSEATTSVRSTSTMDIRSITVTAGVSVRIKGDNIRIFFDVDRLPVLVDTNSSVSYDFTLNNCDSSTRTYYFVIECLTGTNCSYTMAVFSRLIRSASLSSFSNALANKKVAGEDGSVIFATRLDPVVFPRANLRIYHASNYTLSTTQWGHTVDVDSTSLMWIGQPTWTDSLVGQPNIRAINTLEQELKQSYQSCALDAGALLSVNFNGTAVLTSTSATCFSLLATGDLGLLELDEACLDNRVGTFSLMHIAQLYLSESNAFVLLNIMPSGDNKVSLAHFARNETNLIFVKVFDVCTSGVDMDTQHHMDVDEPSGLAVVGLPEKASIFLLNITTGQLLLTLSRSDPQFGSGVEFDSLGTSMIVSAAFRVIMYTVTHNVSGGINVTELWTLPDSMQSVGRSDAFSQAPLGVKLFSFDPDSVHADRVLYPTRRQLLASSSASSETTAVVLTSSSSTSAGSEFDVFQETSSGVTWNSFSKSSNPCPAGTYKNTTGLASCNFCSEGTYQPSSGATSCLVCNSTLFCPEGAVRPVNPSSSTAVHNFPFPEDNVDDGGEAIVLYRLFLRKDQPIFYINMVLIGILVIFGALYWIPCCCTTGTIHRISMQISRLDRDKSVEFDPQHNRILEVGSATGGLLALWLYAAILMGLIFLIIYANSFAQCTVVYVPSFDQSFQSAYTTSFSSVAVSSSVCPTQSGANIDRSSAVKPFSAASGLTSQILENMKTQRPINITVGLIGFSNWLNPNNCSDVCSRMSFTTSGCLAGSQACSTVGWPTCSTNHEYTCAVTFSLPAGRTMADQSSYQFGFTSEVYTSAIETIIYSDSTIQSNYSTLGSFARSYMIPFSGTNTMVRGPTVVSVASTLGVRTTKDVYDNTIQTVGFAEYTADTTVPGTRSQSQVLFGPTNINVTITLSLSNFWNDQEEVPKQTSDGLLFATVLAIIVLFDVLEAVQNLFEVLAIGLNFIVRSCKRGAGHARKTATATSLRAFRTLGGGHVYVKPAMPTVFGKSSSIQGAVKPPDPQLSPTLVTDVTDVDDIDADDSLIQDVDDYQSPSPQYQRQQRQRQQQQQQQQQQQGNSFTRTPTVGPPSVSVQELHRADFHRSHTVNLHDIIHDTESYRTMIPPRDAHFRSTRSDDSDDMSSTSHVSLDPLILSSLQQTPIRLAPSVGGGDDVRTLHPNSIPSSSTTPTGRSTPTNHSLPPLRVRQFPRSNLSSAHSSDSDRSHHSDV